MRANGIIANLRVADIDTAKAFYTDFLVRAPDGNVVNVVDHRD